MKKLLMGTAAAVVAISVIAYVKRDALLDRLMLRNIDRVLTRVDETPLTDGDLHVVLAGTAAAIPDADRAGPSTAILAGGEFILVDAGPASWRNLDLMNLPVGKLSAVLITHLHSDHIGDLGEAIVQSWIAGRTEPLDVYGPPGIEDVVEGLRRVYARDTQYRVEHHGADYMPPSGAEVRAHTLALNDDGTPVFARNGVTVTAFAVQHAPVDAALGYRIEFGGRVVVLSGDTTRTANVVRHARNADLLIHEALASHMTQRASARAAELGLARMAKLASDVRDYHTTPVEAAQVAAEAGAKMLVFSHVFPPLANPLAERLFLAGTRDVFGGKIVLGQDRQRFDLPADRTGP